MPTFKFVAINKTGKKVKDTVVANDINGARDKIRERELYLSSIKEVKKHSNNNKKKSVGITIGGVSSKQLNVFTRQLSTLINADVPIVRSLNILEMQMKPCLLKKNLMAIVGDIENGSSLSGAMAKHKRAFSKIYVNTIKAGEIGGMLDQILLRLADFLEKIDGLKKKIVSALAYPISVVVIATGIIAGIMMFIIPNFVKMFDDMEVDGGLPIMTQIVIVISDFMVDYWYFLFGVPFGLFFFKKLLSKIRKVKYVMDKASFRIPVFGKIINKASVSGFCRTLATLTTAGVPILDALTNTKDATKNEALVVAIENIGDSVREGGTIGDPLRKSRVTEEIVINMVEVGEETGELDKMLTKVSDNLDAEVDAIVDAMTSLIEPLLIVFLGGAIGFIVIAMFMPLIKLMQSLG